MRYLVLILFLFALLSGGGAYAATYQLGATVVVIKVSGRAGGLTYFAPHDNENTSVAAAKAVIAREGGWLIELVHKGTRNISFTLEGRQCVFDPNRMFTAAGISKTLAALSKGCPKSAHALVKGLADAVVAEIKKRPVRGIRVVVALHNNTDGSYSATSYLPGGQNAREASQVYINPQYDPDDFFLVTHRGVFESMKEAGYNVVLQSRSATNDGSLSVYAASAGLAYVNAEAQNGHSAAQFQMLDNLFP